MQRKTSSFIAGCMAVVLSAPPVWAADIIAVYALAQENDPALRRAEATARAARTALPQAEAGILPELAIRGSYDRQRLDDQATDGDISYNKNQSYSIDLTQPIYRRDRIIQLRLADEQVAQAEAALTTAQQDLMVRVTERYFGVLSANNALEFAKAQKTANGRQLEQAKKRFEVGLIAITDVHEAQAAYDLAVAQEISAENQVDASLEALREITDTEVAMLARLKRKLPLIPPEPADVEYWTKTALEQNLTLKIAEYDYDIARHQIKLSKAGHHPSIDLTASHGYTDRNFGGLAQIEQIDSSIGVVLNIPIYSGGLIHAKTEQAIALADQAREAMIELRRNTLKQARDAYRGVLSGISQVKALKQATISSESALETTEAGFEVGTRTIVDVLVAQRALFGAKRDYEQSRYDYFLNQLRLKQAAGTLVIADLEKLNTLLEASEDSDG